MKKAYLPVKELLKAVPGYILNSFRERGTPTVDRPDYLKPFEIVSEISRLT